MPPLTRKALLLSAMLMLLVSALAVSGCTNPLGGSPPSVTVAPTYVPPSPSPIPRESPTPVPVNTTWNGLYVKLYGNVNGKGDEHVYGTVSIFYLDENYWEDNPTAKYDTTEGGAYSVSVRANVPFKIKIGYLYVGRLPEVMNVKLINDKIYQLNEDTKLDFSIMTSNITPVK
jgi:hypothetical protein